MSAERLGKMHQHRNFCVNLFCKYLILHYHVAFLMGNYHCVFTLISSMIPVLPFLESFSGTMFHFPSTVIMNLTLKIEQLNMKQKPFSFA